MPICHTVATEIDSDLLVYNKSKATILNIAERWI